MCWWCLGRVSVMCSDCVVMFWWYVDDALVLCWWCLCSVSVMLWCLSDGWWCCGDEHWWAFSDFQWVPTQKAWLFHVCLLLGSYAGLIVGDPYKMGPEPIVINGGIFSPINGRKQMGSCWFFSPLFLWSYNPRLTTGGGPSCRIIENFQ